jgi:hypothetical protein
MPLYEIVLRYPDGWDEVRFTDRPVALGDRIRVANRLWDVVLERKPAVPFATAGFVCDLPPDHARRRVSTRPAR